MSDTPFTYAWWRLECTHRFRAMSDNELICALTEHTNDTDCDGLWMISLGHLLHEMRERGWDISALWIENDREIRPCLLKDNVLVPRDTTDMTESLPPPEQAKQYITPSFSLVCTRHWKMGRYDKIREYDIYLINQSDVNYKHVWLSTSFPFGEDDSEIWPIPANSARHLWTVKRNQINSPYIFDVYEHLGMKPHTFIAEIPEEALYSRNRKFIKCLNQEWWTIELKQEIHDETPSIKNDHSV